MNVLEGVVGLDCVRQVGWRVDSPKGASLGEVTRTCAPKGGRTHQWTVESRQRVRLAELAPAAATWASFFPDETMEFGTTRLDAHFALPVAAADGW